jgi:hypothetical protein
VVQPVVVCPVRVLTEWPALQLTTGRGPSVHSPMVGGCLTTVDQAANIWSNGTRLLLQAYL